MNTLQPRAGLPGHEHEGRARVRKALALAGVAEGRVTSTELGTLVGGMGDARVAAGLRALERAAGVREGSRETWGVVVGILRDREMEGRRARSGGGGKRARAQRT